MVCDRQRMAATPSLLREMADSRFRAGNIQDEPETSHHTREQLKTSRTLSKELRSQLKEAALPKLGNLSISQDDHQDGLEQI